MQRWGEFRPPGGQNQAFVGLCSQNAPLEPREPGHSKNWVNTAFSLDTHLISSGARGGRGMREKGMDGGAERREEMPLRRCPLLETLPAAHSRKWPPQPGLHRDPKLGPNLSGNELLTATPTPAPVQPPGSLLGTHISVSPFDLHEGLPISSLLPGQDLVVPYGTHDTEMHTKLPTGVIPLCKGTTYVFHEKSKQKKKQRNPNKFNLQQCFLLHLPCSYSFSF